MVRLFELAARRRLALAYLVLPVALAPAVAPGCYSTGNGTPPPPAIFYFPVGLTVSRGGNVLYVVNSDFDLQWNGGTVQSYDLHAIRRDAAISAAGYSLSNQLPFPPGGGAALFFDGGQAPPGADPCAQGRFVFLADGGLVSACSPYVDSSVYQKDSVTIGAFATDIQIAQRIDAYGSTVRGSRLFIPVRGDASLTWIDVVPDTDPPTDGQAACDADAGAATCYAPFTLTCGQASNGGRCDAAHHAGVDPNEPGNTRNLTMPGEPFAMAQSSDGTAIVITHQSEGDTSLFLTGLSDDGGAASPSTPSMQFVVDAGLPTGGDGIGTIPHDPAAYACPGGASGACDAFPRPAFLETNNSTAELSVIRYYADDGTTTLPRPFLAVERTLALTTLSGGTDSRGVAFDTSARLACEHLFPAPDTRNRDCARLPARVFFANRTPNSLLIGTTGGPSATDPAAYDADSIALNATPVTLDGGPSRVYVAPIIDADGDYALRVFVACFNNNSIDVVNPDTGHVEASITVGGGPFAMTFDPYDALDLALHAHVQPAGAPTTVSFRPSDGGSAVQVPLPKYRFAYIASFTNSYVQVIDLDNSEPSKSTFETVVYTLGTPTVPKGNQ